MSHAGYYPGGKVMTMKVIFEKESYRLLGTQIIGYEGVDKRIDVLATAIPNFFHCICPFGIRPCFNEGKEL